MVELALSTAADNSKDARAALAVLQRTGAEPTGRMCDALLRPHVADGTTPWEKLLLENACPKLNERLVRSPRLHVAAQSLELLLKTLVPKRRAAAIALMRYQRSLPDGLHAALVAPAVNGGSKWQALVRDEECQGLVKMLLAREPALTTPALLAALAPGFTYYYDVCATTPKSPVHLGRLIHWLACPGWLALVGCSSLQSLPCTAGAVSALSCCLGVMLLAAHTSCCFPRGTYNHAEPLVDRSPCLDATTGLEPPVRAERRHEHRGAAAARRRGGWQHHPVGTPGAARAVAPRPSPLVGP